MNNDEKFIEVGGVYLRNEENKNKEEWDCEWECEWDVEETEDNEKIMTNYTISVD
jgi:hypothetical protein